MKARVFVPEKLMADASTAAGGLSDFGDASFLPALEALCFALDREGRLSEAGAAVAKAKTRWPAHQPPAAWSPGLKSTQKSPMKKSRHRW